jgi:hypothetical protein
LKGFLIGDIGWGQALQKISDVVVLVMERDFKVVLYSFN